MYDIFVVTKNKSQCDLLDRFPHCKTVEYTPNKVELLRAVAGQSATRHAWIVSADCDYSNFDFNYMPPWHQETQLHVWPTENQTLGGDTCLINTKEFLKQASTLDYVQNYKDVCWKDSSINQKVQPEVFVWSRSSTADLISVDATFLRYVGDPLSMMKKTVRRATTPYIWIVNDECDYRDFDFTWRPSWASEQYLHVWPTENQTLGGDTFYVNVEEFLQQQDTIESLDHYQTVHWHNQQIKQKITPEIFIWDKGNAQRLKEQFPNATAIRYFGSKFDMMKRTIAKSQTANIWVIGDNCDYKDFDFSWRPSWATDAHMHVWPTENQTSGGDTFYVNVAEFQRQSFEIDSLNDYTVVNWHTDAIKENVAPDVVIWDSGSSETNINNLKEKFPNAKVLRNVGSRFDMLNRSMRHIKTTHAWIISSKCNYNEFDFTWRPDWATERHIHVWPTENQTKGGDTFFVDVAEFQKQSLHISTVEEYNAVSWHKQNVSLFDDVDVIIWAMGGNDTNLSLLKERYPHAKSLRYIGTHLDMVKKSAKYTTSEYFWVLSDCCDYTDFSTNWRSDWEEETSIHCWASGTQKFGDTFYIPRAEFLKEADDLEKLEYYSSIIWHKDGYNRYPWPVNYVDADDLFSTLKNHKFSTLYEYFIMPGSTLGSTVDIGLWEKRLLIAYNKNGHVSLCPRDCISEILTKVKDYPYIQYHNCENSTQQPQDIVFISYDEKNANLNYKILKDRFPNAQRVHGVEGMVNAIKQSATQSDTPWFYAVFAKTEIDEKFKFEFNPDYLETPGNYVFYSYNPVLDYSYGHDGIVLYHKKSVLDVETWGVDFTMSFPVTTIPVISCRNNYNYSQYSAWRTALREAYKLKKTNHIADQYHLHLWLTANNSLYGDWSNAGAKDALLLPDNMDEKINDWNWLKNYFNEKYSNIDDAT